MKEAKPRFGAIPEVLLTCTISAATCTVQAGEKLGSDASLSSGKSSSRVGVDEEGFLIIA